MTPMQAVAAAKALGAARLVPIHHGLHEAGRYEEEPRMLVQLRQYAGLAGVTLLETQPGSSISLPVAG
jgi:L-ascorbate metabolism protein UlaG (beta-lactamase superfamily)